MKKLYASALGAALMTFLLPAASAADGTIAVSGVIGTSTCTIVPGASKPLAVALGNYMASDFPAAGTRGNTVTALFNLTNCPPGTQIAYQFDGVADSNNNKLFKVTEGDGYAKGIGFELKTVGNGTNTPAAAIFDVTPGMTSPWITVFSLSSTVGVIYNKLNVTPISTLDNVTGGKLDTTITMTFKYN